MGELNSLTGLYLQVDREEIEAHTALVCPKIWRTGSPVSELALADALKVNEAPLSIRLEPCTHVRCASRDLSCHFISPGKCAQCSKELRQNPYIHWIGQHTYPPHDEYCSR